MIKKGGECAGVGWLRLLFSFCLLYQMHDHIEPLTSGGVLGDMTTQRIFNRVWAAVRVVAALRFSGAGAWPMPSVLFLGC